MEAYEGGKLSVNLRSKHLALAYESADMRNVIFHLVVFNDKAGLAHSERPYDAVVLKRTQRPGGETVLKARLVNGKFGLELTHNIVSNSPMTHAAAHILGGVEGVKSGFPVGAPEHVYAAAVAQQDSVACAVFQLGDIAANKRFKHIYRECAERAQSFHCLRDDAHICLAGHCTAAFA